MDRVARTDRFAGQLRATIRDHFVGVGVGARAGAGLKNIEREMRIELSFDHFFRGLNNERRPVGIEQPEIVIGLRRRPFDQPQRPNERPGKTITADRKIQNRSLSGGAV